MASSRNANAVFVDVNTNYDRGSPELVINMKAINNSIFNILSTPIGTRVFRPTFGTSLHKYVNDPMDTQTALLIKASVAAALDKWEPRIKIDYHNTDVIPIPSGGFRIVVAYYIVGLSVNTNVSISFNP